MIKGIGIDLVDLKRISKHVSKRFIDRILTQEEQIVYDDIQDDKTKLTFLGGRFAAKEALFKAISKGDGHTNYTDFSILNQKDGKPYLVTNYFKDKEIIHISITHTEEHAIAYVIIEQL